MSVAPVRSRILRVAAVSQVYNSDLENNYELLKEYLVELSPRCPSMGVFESAFVLLSINLNIHGETVYHMRGGKGQCREARQQIQLYCIDLHASSHELLALIIIWAFLYMPCQGVGEGGSRPLQIHDHAHREDGEEDFGGKDCCKACDLYCLAFRFLISCIA